MKKIEPLLYKQMKFRKSKYLEVSPASLEKDAQVMYDARGLPVMSDDNSAGSFSFPVTPEEQFKIKFDAIFQVRDRVEFVVKDHLEMAEEQVIKLKHYIRYCGLTFEEILFELRRQIFENNMDT